MGVDRPTPLASVDDMDRSTLRHLITGLDREEAEAVMMRATRACEAYCGGRRLAPFTGVKETHRAEGVDTSELGDLSASGDPFVVLGMSYSRAMGAAGGQVRKLWVDQYAPLFPEMWSYRDVTVRILRAGGTLQTLAPADLIGDGIAPDTGELWLRVGTWLPVGSRVEVTYSGGYHTVPGDLVSACRWMAAAELVDEDDYPGDAPARNSHGSQEETGSDGGFLARAYKALAPYRSRR